MIENSKIMGMASHALKGFRLNAAGTSVFWGILIAVSAFSINLASILFMDSNENSSRNYLVSFTAEMVQSIAVHMFIIGFYAYFYGIYKQKVASFKKLFIGFKNFSRNAVVLIIGALVMGFLSTIAEATLQYCLDHYPILENIVFYIFLAIVYISFLCLVAYKLYPTWLGLMLKMSMDNSTEAISLIRETYSQVSAYNNKFVGLYFRFLGWSIVGCLTFGIGFLWILPYLTMATVIFFDIIFYPEDYAVPEDPAT
ncbi:DUF975 family protein [Fibrobacter sp. UBA4309]|uniref:DUF975 family protein n=1 Tax=Fibrobacter sp. UBA4309 TaxID=1946537 RepID=UPI0025C710FD|nr:DUF975 family protein [Fibrobacter sp. UBA4309]